jgi:ribosomal protein S27AE
LIPNGFVPIDAEPSAGYNLPKTDPSRGHLLGKQIDEPSGVAPWQPPPGVGIATVAHGVKRAQGQRLDRVDRPARSPAPHQTRRTDTALEDLVLKTRAELAQGDLGASAAAPSGRRFGSRASRWCPRCGPSCALFTVRDQLALTRCGLAAFFAARVFLLPCTDFVHMATPGSNRCYLCTPVQIGRPAEALPCGAIVRAEPVFHIGKNAEIPTFPAASQPAQGRDR